jgi:lysophospholipase L1-like esterase
MLERFYRSVALKKPDIVLIWGGINDLSTRISADSVLRNIIKLVEKTQCINAVPIVLSVTPVSGTHFNETVTELNRLVQEYCAKYCIEYVEIFSELVDGEGKLATKYSNDGVHLSDQAYKKITSLLFYSIMGIIEADEKRFT